MKISRRISLLLLLVMSGCAYPASFDHPYASGHYSPQIEQCALYARKVSGVELYGDADGWWKEARGHYKRGHAPSPGAVLVLRQTTRMHSGHVAVVKSIVSDRRIIITHSNWGDTSKTRHIIYDAMLAEDVSENNDWSEVRFWNDGKGVMGFPYAAYGFIYP